MHELVIKIEYNNMHGERIKKMCSIVLSVGFCTALLEKGIGIPKSDGCARMCVTYCSEL